MSDAKEKPTSTAPEGAGALEPFQRMREDMMSMADNFWRNTPGEALPWPWAPSGFMRWANPPIDMTETDEGYMITVELARLKKEDVNVEIDDHVLTISGSKEDVHKEKRKHHQFAERRFGSFKRMVSLPRDADPEQIDASFGDGLLTVTIPKRPGSDNARKVDIK